MRVLNYIKISLRTLFLHRSFSLLTLLGLSVGIAMSIFVLEYVFYQFSFDKHYADSDRIYRMVSEGRLGDESVHAALTPMMLSKKLDSCHEEGVVTRVMDASEKPVRSAFARSYEENVIFADSSFFEVFQRSFLAGDPQDCFVDSSCVVISASAANRLFGDRDPVGQTIHIENDEKFTVKGVFEDVPRNTHFRYDFVLPFRNVEQKLEERYGEDYEEISDSWFSLVTYTYFRNSRDGDLAQVQNDLNAIASSDMNREARDLFGDMEDAGLEFKFQAIDDIYLFSDYDFELGVTTDSLYVFVFLGVALFILMVTVFNFMNLITARALDRAREAGVRRMFGAERWHLIIQFISESVLFSFVALFLGMVLVELLSPVFSRMFAMEFFEVGSRESLDLPWILGVTLLVGFSSGIYPAMVFSGVRGVHLQKGYQKFSSRPGLWIRGVLVLIQVFVAVMLAVTAIGMERQFRYMENADVGYDPSELLLVEQAHYLDGAANEVIREIRGLKDVEHVSKIFHTPGEPVSVMSFHFSENRERMYMLSVYPVDSAYFNTLKSHIREGRFEPHDSTSVLINEEALDLLGGEEMTGQYLHTISRQPGRVIDLEITGVVEDIHHGSMKQNLRPSVYLPAGSDETPTHLMVRYKPDKRNQVVSRMEEIWDEAGTGAPFSVVDVKTKLDSFYQEDHRYGSLTSAFAFLIVIISSLGMIGLVSFLLATHQQEMLLKKIHGVPDSGILFGRFRSYLLFVLVGILPALPMSRMLLGRWLEAFSLHFEIDSLCFLLPALFMLVLAVLIAYISGKRILRRMSLHHF